VTAVELYHAVWYTGCVTLRPSTLERVGGYWSRSLGCDRDALSRTGPTVVPGRTGRDEVRLLACDDATVVVSPSERLSEVRRTVEAAEGRDAPDLVAAFDPPPGSVRGPQFVGYLIRGESPGLQAGRESDNMDVTADTAQSGVSLTRSLSLRVADI
jgi:hypothetical protein